MQTPALLLHALYVFMRDNGGPSEELLEKSGLNVAQLDHVSPMVDAATLATAIDMAVRTGGETLALQLGSKTPLWALGTFGELVSQCPDLRSGLEAVKRFLPLLQRGGKLAISENGQVATVTYEPAFMRSEYRRFASELALSMMTTVAREFIGERANPLRVQLPYPAPSYAAEYDALFKCPVEFNAPHTALHFDIAALSIPRPFVDQQLREWLELKLDRMLRADDRSSPLHARIRAILHREHNFAPSENTFRAISNRLGITPRSLRRKLCAEGLTLSGLVDESRKNLAIYLVAEADVPVKSIPKRLGFSELSAFYRAFKRWTGMTPVQYRALREKQARQEASAA